MSTINQTKKNKQTK